MKNHFHDIFQILKGMFFMGGIWFHTWFWENALELKNWEILAFPIMLFGSVYMLVIFLLDVWVPIDTYIENHWQDDE